MASNYETLASSVVHQNPWFRVTKDVVTRPNAEKGEYFTVQPSPGVVVVPVNDKGHVTLVQLFRYTTKTNSIEVPAGGTDGEEPIVAAKRELQEETGLVANNWTHIGRFQMANGMSDQWSDVYLARDLTATTNHEQPEEGIEETLCVSIPSAMKMVKDGRITDVASVAALFLANEFLQ